MKENEKGGSAMKKATQWKLKIAVTVIYLGILLALRYFQVPCIFIRLFQVPCPGCGMSRAWEAALHLDLLKAFQYHPMFWSMPVLYLYFFFDGWFFGGKKPERIFLWSIGVGFLLQWVWKLVIL